MIANNENRFPRVWTSRMRRFLESQEFSPNEVEACIQFVETFARQELPAYLRAADAIQGYFQATMILADEEIRREHSRIANGIGHLANQIADVSHFQHDLDEDTFDSN